MLLKFFNRGTGKGKTPVEYLLRETDSNGVRREPAPSLPRGDPEQIIQLIDSLDFKHKYRSGVISFAPEDAPTQEQQFALMDSFEKTAFAGLDRERYSILWVRHTHTGDNRVELHFITPRVELVTGKSLNIAPPGWGNYFRPWRDYWNSNQGWASPDDPQRARTYHPGYQALIDAQNNRLELAGKPTQTREDYRQAITNYLGENIKLGRIKDRFDVISILSQSGFEITRTGENYLTVFREDIGKKIRLKGGIYDASWRLGAGLTAETVRGEETDRAVALSRTREAEAELRARVQSRLNYHQSRYGNNETHNQHSMEMVSAPAIRNHPKPLNSFLREQLGDDAIISQPSQRDSNSKTDLRNPQGKDLGNRNLPNQERQISHPTTRHRIPDQLAMQRQTLLEAIKEDDERIRTRITTNLEELCHSIRRGQTAAEQTNQQLSRANTIAQEYHQWLEQSNQSLRTRLSRHHEHLRVIEMKRNEELDQFKSKINLVEYAQSNGYELDKKNLVLIV